MLLPFQNPQTTPHHFQLMSDIHLEVSQQYQTLHVQPCTAFLILAGVIGRLVDYNPFRDFLATQCRQFKQVFLVLGNHEFFGNTRSHDLLQAEKLEKEEMMRGHLSVMHRKRIDLAPGITVLGCTLQSYIPDGSKDKVSSKINDFRHIGDWTETEHNEEHAHDVAWLKNEIQTIRQIKETLL